MQRSLNVRVHFANSCLVSLLDGIFHYFTIVITVQVSLHGLFTVLQEHSLLCAFQDLGKVLAGVQVPPNENEQFQQFLEQLGFDYVEETDNEVYKRYIRG